MTAWRAVILLVSAVLPAVAADIPAWLSELTRVNPPAYDRKVNAVVLLNEETDRIAPGNKIISTTRTAIRYINQVGNDIRFSEDYDVNSGKVRDFTAWTISSAGKVKKYGKDEILDVACVNNDVYNECRRRLVSGKADAEAGAVFAYEATVERQLYSSQILFHFQDALPVRLARLTVYAPPGVDVTGMPFNGAPASALNSGEAMTWQMENLAPLELEDFSPGISTLVPWVGVSLAEKGQKAQTWSDAAKQLVSLNEGVSEPNEAIAAKARSLTEGLTSEMDKIRAIGKFTQQLNYVSIQVSLANGGGYRPHAASAVFAKLYGDCKDKANLTRAMLKAVGITAYPVAIYSGDRTHVREQWVSLGAFNHAISAIRVSPETRGPAILDDPAMGRLMFFDSTDPYTPPGLIPEHEQGSRALVGIPESGGLIKIPAAPGTPTDHERTVDVEISPQGILVASFVETSRGTALGSAAAEYRSMSKTDFSRRMERWLSYSVSGAVSPGVEIEDNGTEFVIKGKFTAPRYGQLPQAGLMTIRSAPLRDGGLIVLTPKTRVSPVDLDGDLLKETVRFTLPAGFKPDELPRPVHLESPFGRFHAEWKSETAGQIVFQRTVEIPPQNVPAAQYTELKKFLDAVRGAPEELLVLVR